MDVVVSKHTALIKSKLVCMIYGTSPSAVITFYGDVQTN